MGNGTNFDPDILEDAYNDLARIATIIKASTSLKDKDTAADITSDVGGLDDENGGWAYLSGQVSAVGRTVAQYVGDLQTTANSVHEAMRASIDTLSGADTDSTSAVNRSAPKGVG